MAATPTRSPFPYPPDQLLQPGAPPAIEFGRLIDDLAERLSVPEEPGVPAESRRLIYVASSSLTAKRDRLSGDLRGKGHRTIAETPWPGATADEFRERVGMRLVECDSSIHLGGPSAPRVDGWDEPVPDIELGKAMEVAARPDKSRFRIFSWEESSAGRASAGFGPQVAERLNQTRVAVNFKGKGWEYMLSNVFLGLNDLAAPPLEAPPPVEPTDDYTCQVFVQCLDDDRGLAQEIRDKLRAHRIWVNFLPQPFEFWRRLQVRKKRAADDQSIVDRYQRFYKECDGSVVLYGQSNELWALGRCDDINDFFGPQLAAQGAGHLCRAARRRPQAEFPVSRFLAVSPLRHRKIRAAPALRAAEARLIGYDA